MTAWNDAIHRNAGNETAHKIGFYPSVRFLQDETFCRLLNDDLLKNCSPWEIRKATPKLWDQLPDEPGLYLFMWRPEQLNFRTESTSKSIPWCLYIGKTEDSLKARYKREYSNYLSEHRPAEFWDSAPVISRATRLSRLLTLTPLEFWYCVIRHRDVISNLEERLIKVYNPPGNVKNRLRPTSVPFPAFRSY